MRVNSPSNIAVHHIGTRVFFTFHQRWEESGLIYVEQQESEHSIHHYLKKQAEEVGPPETPSLLPCVAIERGTVFSIFQPMLALTFLSVGHMKRHKKGRAGDKDQLESPESGVGDREVVVIADIVTTRLPGVAIKVLLLVTPDLLTGHQEDQESEDEDDGEPDATERRGVLVHAAKETLKEGPVHGYLEETRCPKTALNLAGAWLAECSNADGQGTN